jgi:ferric-dicitrate binding protein FerR (iron transport regulator)
MITLDSVKSGTIALQNNIAVTKSTDGKIEYAPGEKKGAPGLTYNTLTNPKGSRVVNMVLNDGSKVWLNAASSITYPVAFDGVNREVSVTGEVYFEVAHDQNKKFIVKSNRLSTEVLGTYFNVNSYSDEDEIKVTLLEGSVRVLSKNGSPYIVKPGEQAIDEGNGKIRIEKNVNVEDMVAWKNERFSFTNANIKSIMKEVARWYDVQIEYKGNVDDLNFGGNMSRQRNVSELLKRMEATQAVKFEVEGRKITVKKLSG